MTAPLRLPDKPFSCLDYVLAVGIPIQDLLPYRLCTRIVAHHPENLSKMRTNLSVG